MQSSDDLTRNDTRARVGQGKPRKMAGIQPPNAPIFDLAAGPLPNAVPPVQLPLVLQRIQELNAQPNGPAAPNPAFPLGQPVNPASGYQFPQFAHLTPRNGEFPAPGQPVALAYPPVPGQGTADPAWQRGPQNFSVEAAPRTAPAAQNERPLPPRSPETRPNVQFEPSEDEALTETLPYPDSYQAIYRRLLDQDMPEPMARSLVEHALRSQGPEAAPERIENALRTALLAVVRTAPVADRENPKPAKSASPDSASKDRDPWQILEEELAGGATASCSAPNGPTLVAFVGTAGVGKTASLAKLAAHFANRKIRSVGLIGIETPHLGSVDQLQACGELLGTPVRRVRSPAQLAEAVKEMQDRAYILIDTPPCSLRPVERKNARSPFQPKHLKPFLEAVPGIQTQLVLSATTRARDIRTTIKTFGQIPVSALVFTKLDETHALGHLLGLLQETNLPVSYLTSGREIPDDLETATPEGLIERVLGEDA
jgi:flagellar biosynthesis GTPase FlhF